MAKKANDILSKTLIPAEQSDVIIYTSKDGKANVTLMTREGKVWLTQKQMAQLFATSAQNVGQHVAKVLADKELDANSVIKQFFTTAADGKPYNTYYYSLDMIGRSHEDGSRLEEKRYERGVCSMLSLNPLPWRSSSKAQVKCFLHRPIVSFSGEKDEKDKKDRFANFANFATTYFGRVARVATVGVATVGVEKRKKNGGESEKNRRKIVESLRYAAMIVMVMMIGVQGVWGETILVPR